MCLSEISDEAADGETAGYFMEQWLRVADTRLVSEKFLTQIRTR